MARIADAIEVTQPDAGTEEIWATYTSVTLAWRDGRTQRMAVCADCMQHSMDIKAFKTGIGHYVNRPVATHMHCEQCGSRVSRMVRG